MIQIKSKIKREVTSSNLNSINIVTSNIMNSHNITQLNNGTANQTSVNSTVTQPQEATVNQTTSQQAVATPVVPQATTTTTTSKQLPTFSNPMSKGQKVALQIQPNAKIKACLGWNTNDARCDLDVSAFLLSNQGKVIGDDWFVFYGQESSPDQSTIFSVVEDPCDRERIAIDFSKLNPAIEKIVFVLTINEAFAQNLNFSMVKDAYIKIIDCATNAELASYKMTEYYSNVISMMIGEIYKYNGAWKFNAIGNGVAKDLENLCELYGVQVI